MIDIFISYRHDETWGTTLLMWNRLQEEFGHSHVALDFERTRNAEPFGHTVLADVKSSALVLMVIGPKWNEDRDGLGRLEDPHDWVRKEIQEAVENNKIIIPVLVHGARLPALNDLPESIRDSFDLTHEKIDHEQFDRSMEGLTSRIMNALLDHAPDSSAIAHAVARSLAPRPCIVVRYELTGFRDAIEDGETTWYDNSLFADVAPRFLLDARSHVSRRIARAGRVFTAQDLPSGSVLFIDYDAHPEEALAAVANAAKDVVDRFPEFVATCSPADASGFHWIIDIRFVITLGQVRGFAGRDRTGPMTHYTGLPLEDGALILRHQDGQQRPLLRRGEVAVLPGNIGRAPQDFRTALSDDWGGVVQRLNGRRASLQAPAQVWLAKRSPITNLHLRISDRIAGELKSMAMTTDERAKDLARHIPPSNYEKIAKLAKTGDRFCIIVGKPGAGKTLCGLRLAAELMYVDGFEVSVPPVASETWSQLKMIGSPRKARQVVFLDDAFGKIRLNSEFAEALDALRPGEADEDGLPFLSQGIDTRPSLIITVRQDIWENARKLKGWEKILGGYAVTISERSYSDANRSDLFARHWEAAGGQPGPVFSYLKNAVADITHPLSIRDLAWECKGLGRSEAARRLPDYRRDALDRYVTQLETASRKATLLWHFLTWGFSGTLLNKDELKKLFFTLTPLIGDSGGSASDIWDKEPQTHWGVWVTDDYFTLAHPLREEAVETFFRSEQRQEQIESFLAAMLQAPRALEEGYDNLSLAAFVTPRIGGEPGRYRREIIERVVEAPDSEAARLLATSIGLALRRSPAAGGEGAADQPVFVAALERLLASARHASFGAAFAVLCDAIRDVDDVPRQFRRALNIALRELYEAAPLGQSRQDMAPAVRAIVDQNVDHAAWAIASNFPRLPVELRDLLEKLVTACTDDWLRLRAVEAVADYITTIGEFGRQPGDSASSKQRFEDFIELAAHPTSPNILRRGVAGAVEANIGDLKFGYDRLIKWLMSASNRHNYGFLEWTIWAAGEHLEDFFEKGDGEALRVALEKLARHEDARVRKWVATALAQNATTKSNYLLRAIMTRFAHDDDDTVRDVAVPFFFPGGR